MNKGNVVHLLQLLGAERITDSNDWVKASCVFAPWTHSKGTDTRPSFGISVGKQSHYHCFTCGRKGPLPILVTALCMLRGSDNLEAREFVMENEDLSIEEYENYKDPEPLAILSPTLLQKFEPADMKLSIVQKRGILPNTIVKFNLRYDNYEKRLIFPVRDRERNLVGFRGRATLDSDKLKYREYSELAPKKQSLKGHGLWYGIDFLPPPDKKVILVEGEMDAIKLSQAIHLRDGILASMGASISDAQIKTIQGIRNPVVLFFDNDEAGKQATNKILSKLKGVKPCIFIIRDYAGCKDPDEIASKGRLKVALQSMEMIA
jgi:5S rRNA maturation endonuclease (ribonuclease M5)